MFSSAEVRMPERAGSSMRGTKQTHFSKGIYPSLFIDYNRQAFLWSHQNSDFSAFNHQDCTPEIPIYPIAPSTPEKKTRKYFGTSVATASAAIPPRPSPPSPPVGLGAPGLQGPRPQTLADPPTTGSPERPESRLCGSLGFRGCPDGEVCVDNPFQDGCFTALDCPGYCARLDNSVCGPVFEVACPIEDQICVRDPREKCVGKVCPGTCVFLNLERVAAIA